MLIQLIDIFYPNVFKRYSSKYNIYRELYENDLTGMEIRAITPKLAGRIKKIILNNKEICYISPNQPGGTQDILVLGTYGIFKEIAKEIIATGNEEIGFKITHVIKNISEYDKLCLNIDDKVFPMDKAYVMGILNVTPDSFSDGGKFLNKEAAVEHSIRMLDEGASFIDIGGESTRPGANPVSNDEELDRVIPIIESIIKLKPEAIISIDTTKSTVAEEALKKGAKVVNDISSFSDPNLLETVKRFNASLILMHMKGSPKTMQISPAYDDVVSEIYDYLIDKCEIAKKAGIKNIIIDPGIGFGKRIFDNYELIKRLSEFKGIGHPILIGVSRKTFIGGPLKLGIEDREEATLAAETTAIKNGARIIRTHTVKKTILASRINYFIENPESLNNV